MNETEKAYVAGLLDGEGCFIIRDNGYIGVSIAAQDLDLLKWLQTLCKFTIYNHSRVYRLQSSDPKKIVPFLEAVAPYMQTKYKLAKNMLAYILVRANTPAEDYAARNKKLNHILSEAFTPLDAPLKWVDKQPSTESKGGE